MEKKIIYILIIIIVSIIGTMNFNMTLSSNSVQLKNIEALANGESGVSRKYDCYSILEGNSGISVFCSTCDAKTGIPPWYHFGSTCKK